MASPRLTRVSANENHPPTLSAEDLRSLGVLHEINRLILHPLGLALFVDPEANMMGVFDMRSDPEGVFYHDETLSAEKAAAVAHMIEQRGPARMAELGYVIQPLPPEVKQLKVSILEHTTTVIGGPDDLDEGEELEFAMRQGVIYD